MLPISARVAGGSGARRLFVSNPRGCVQTRGMAVNPNDIAKRISSTKSIEKITKSMKMVSAAKLRGDTQRLMDGRPFASMLTKLSEAAMATDAAAADAAAEDGSAVDAELLGKNPLFVLVSSDRGLCGGVNSFVSKRTKQELADAPEGAVYVVGEKGAGQMARTHGKSIVGSVDENWKTPMNFAKACNIAQRVLPAADESGTVRMVYNEFKSAIAYDTMVKKVPNFPLLVRPSDDQGAQELPAPSNQMDIEPDLPADFLQNFFEYAVAVELYGACIENATSEQSARMTAMDNASKNADEMITSLTVLYNRARQARITTELIEIISGAESLKD